MGKQGKLPSGNLAGDKPDLWELSHYGAPASVLSSCPFTSEHGPPNVRHLKGKGKVNNADMKTAILDPIGHSVSANKVDQAQSSSNPSSGLLYMPIAPNLNAKLNLSIINKHHLYGKFVLAVWLLQVTSYHRQHT